MEFIRNHAMPVALESSLAELAQGKPAAVNYLFIPRYYRRATPGEQQAWLERLAEHERPMYDAGQLRFSLEFKNPDTFSPTPYVGTIKMGETLHDVIARDLQENLSYKQGEPFKLQSIEYRDTITAAGEDVPRIIVKVDLSYPLDVSAGKLHGLQTFWAEDDEETYGVQPLDHL
jgi:hypothetical protein